MTVYEEQEWQPGKLGGTALNATRMTHMEEGISGAHAIAEEARQAAYAGGVLFHARGYGAVGDGQTIDGPALQSMLDDVAAAGGGLAIIPGGTYLLSGALRIGRGTVIWAYGATIRQAATGGGLIYNFQPADSFPGYTGRGRIGVFGGTWDANAADGGVGTVIGNGYNGIYLCHAEGITLRDLTVQNVRGGHHLELNAVRDARVERCRFLGYMDPDGTHPYTEAIQVGFALNDGIPVADGTVCRDVTVTDCYVGPSDRFGAPGRLVGNHAHTVPEPHTGIVVVGNRTQDTMREAVNALGWSRSIIADNVVVNAGAAGIAVPTAASLPVHSVMVRDNIIDGSAGPGVSVTGQATAPITELQVLDNISRDAVGSAFSVTYAPGAQVERNAGYSPTTGGVSVSLSDAISVTGNKLRGLAGSGVYVGGCAGPVIADNVVDGCGTHAITLARQGPDTTDALVTGNALRNVGGGAGVRLGVGVLRSTVVSNQVRKGTGAAVNGVSVDAGATGAVVAGNDLSGNAWTAAVAVAIGTGAGTRTDYAGGTAVPGHNLI